MMKNNKLIKNFLKQQMYSYVLSGIVCLNVNKLMGKRYISTISNNINNMNYNNEKQIIFKKYR